MSEIRKMVKNVQDLKYEVTIKGGMYKTVGLSEHGTKLNTATISFKIWKGVFISTRE